LYVFTPIAKQDEEVEQEEEKKKKKKKENRKRMNYCFLLVFVHNE
jgi:hypothetical protein